MSNDFRIGATIETMVRAIAIPDIRMDEIHRRISQPRIPRRRPTFARFALSAATAAIVFAIALPAIAPAFVQTLEARYRAALQALGGNAPPSVPKALVSQLAPRSADLASAQARVAFTIVAPTGLPGNVASSAIQTLPTGAYSKSAHAWQIGSDNVIFVYRRPGGRTFTLVASRYAAGALPSKYMFEAKAPAADGRPVLVRHERFAWRNGDQIMTAIEGNGASTAEIAAIRTAMHGIAVPLRGATAKTPLRVFVLPKP
ncbi:MAG TPA: hypothetical protein VNF68_09195 [Candidatus Baltobacteraceae bacterium]|nr:hypothetical protein [Candidatus Baltobacteraceae bacterium]